MNNQNRKILLCLQSTYYLITGLWPLLHISSFMEVSGYKTDIWLVKTTGVLIVCIGLIQLRELISRDFSLSVVYLSVISATGLLTIDLYYSISGVISKVYLVDATIQFLLICSWIAFLTGSKKK